VLQATGRGLADWQRETPAPLLPRRGCAAFVFRPAVDWLNARINQRLDLMMAAGALQEARAALPDWDPALPSSRAIGAPELIAHLRGDVPLDRAVEAAKLASRQYAKRQRTWFRARMGDWTAVDPGA
jgi:tRNA dimethylallyltransferase